LKREEGKVVETGPKLLAIRKTAQGKGGGEEVSSKKPGRTGSCEHCMGEKKRGDKRAKKISNALRDLRERDEKKDAETAHRGARGI